MQKRTALAFVLAFIWAQGQSALAEPFIDDRTGVADEYFQQSFANHNNSLDNLGSSMRGDSDYTALSNSHGNLTHAQSNIVNTWQTSQDTFFNTQTQALLSGGLHNSNGSNNTSGYNSMNSGMYAGGGSGNQVSPDNWGSGGGSFGGGNYYGSGSSAIDGGW